MSLDEIQNIILPELPPGAPPPMQLVHTQSMMTISEMDADEDDDIIDNINNVMNVNNKNEKDLDIIAELETPMGGVDGLGNDDVYVLVMMVMCC